MVSNTRLYGAAVGVASGGYSVISATTASRMVTAGWLMLVVGAVALVHGIALLTPAADRIGDASGPLMAVYALTMLAIQVGLAAGFLADGSGMGGGMDGGMGSGMGSDAMGSAVGSAGLMGVDLGMTALALVMLASGLIMARGSGMDGGETAAGGTTDGDRM
ncbi:hypothetical protein [Haloparvum alkalitolerans]|uniref:hypothetical protein n=1 Tax=Haloparvum alkalitolerans TaxID=1042953 RepID=UPI003CF318A9